MDTAVRTIARGPLPAERAPAPPTLWAKVHNYLGNPIPLAALLRRPWVHLRHPLPGSADTTTGGATVLPFRRHTTPTPPLTQETNHD